MRHNRSGFRPSNNGGAWGGGGKVSFSSPEPLGPLNRRRLSTKRLWGREWEGLQKKFSRPFRPQFGLKNKGNKGGGGGLGAPGPIPLIRHCINTDIHISLSIVCDIQLARKIKLTCLFIFCPGVTFVCIIVISRQYLISLCTFRDHLISFSITQNPSNLSVLPCVDFSFSFSDYQKVTFFIF